VKSDALSQAADTSHQLAEERVPGKGKLPVREGSTSETKPGERGIVSDQPAETTKPPTQQGEPQESRSGISNDDPKVLPASVKAEQGQSSALMPGSAPPASHPKPSAAKPGTAKKLLEFARNSKNTVKDTTKKFINKIHKR
jgi:hypothetical protein